MSTSHGKLTDMKEYDMNGDSKSYGTGASYSQKRVLADYEKAKQIMYEDQRKYESEKRKAEADAYRKKAEEFAKFSDNMSQLDPQGLEYIKKALGIPGSQIGGVQPYQPLGGVGGQAADWTRHYTGSASVTMTLPYSDATKALPIIATDGTTLRKTMEDAAEFSRSPFSKDSVALEEFGRTGRKPKCIFMSATNGHNLELFELDGYLWVRTTDDDGNMMQVRMSASERARMKEIL